MAVAVSLVPADAGADWLVTPYVGSTFAGETTLLVFERGAGRKLTFGGAVALLSDEFLGIEAEFGHTPGFFNGDDPESLVLSSRITTVTGSVIVAMPLAVTRESLRPYVAGGLGLVQARSTDIVALLPLEEDLLGLTLGAGAIGLVSERTGFRFDLRHFKAVTGEHGPFIRPGISRLSFWRASAGVIFRY